MAEPAAIAQHVAASASASTTAAAKQPRKKQSENECTEDSYFV
jgi:hypothetical protein